MFVVFILEGGLTNIKVRSAVYCGGGGWQHIFVYTYLQPFYTADQIIVNKKNRRTGLHALSVRTDAMRTRTRVVRPNPSHG